MDDKSILPPGKVVDALPDGPRSPDRLPGALFARRLVLNVDGVDSPVRRLPRLSCLPPPQPPIESHDTQDESSEDESDSVNDVALHLSRDETPENDDLPSDEPSSVLANRIMRAHDNPSPPPQDLARPGINYMPGKDGQFPQLNVSVPPSPFRSINLLERLNQFSNPFFDPSLTQRNLPSDVRADLSEPGITFPRAIISPVSSSPSIVSRPMKSIHEDMTSGDATCSSRRRAADAFPSQSSQHVCELANIIGEAVTDASSKIITGLHGQPLPVVDALESKVLISSPTQVVDPSRSLVAPLASGSKSLPGSGRQNAFLQPSAKAIPSNENGQSTDTAAHSGRGEGISSVDNKSLSFLQDERETECKATWPKGVDANSLQRLDCPSPHSTEELAKLESPTKPISSVEQWAVSTEPICIETQSATLPRTPTPSVTHTDFSRTSVQRPIVAPAPARANDARKSPPKLSLEIDDIYRTPAQRVPIETALARGNTSLQRAVQLSTVHDQSRLGRFSTIRAPVFSRQALDDPSRSPAKRILIADTAASPARAYQTQCSPARLALRARSTSVESRPSATTLTRSRSVEPCMTMLKSESYGKIKESIFPMVPILPRAGNKLPFPLISAQQSSGNPPSPIPEEHENAEIGNTGTNTTLTRPMTGNTTSQLRQPTTSSRIPRIGSKPYAKPPNDGRTTASTTRSNATRAPKAPPFKLACKNSGIGNSNAEVFSTEPQPASDQSLVGSLKRKRGAEATVPPNYHPLIICQVIPGMLNEKYAPKPVKLPSQVQASTVSSPSKAPPPMKFRKVVDGMLSARYAPAKTNPPQTEPPPSPLSDLSSLSDEGVPDETSSAGPSACPKSETSDNPQINANAPVTELSKRGPVPSQQDADGDRHPGRPRRTSRTRRPAQQLYVLDVFSDNTSTRPPPTRRKPHPCTDGDHFMGMSATALKTLTTSNTTKNQQTVAVLATEVIRKEGLRPESPMVKARTILQKQRDERDVRRRERSQRKAKMSEVPGCRDGEWQSKLDDVTSLGTREHHDENDCDVPQKHRRGPGDEEDYETPERSECVLGSLKLKPGKQVKWHRGLSTTVYLDEVDPKPKLVPKNVVVRGCLAPTSKNLPLDSLGNLVDMGGRTFPELVSEHVVVKRYLYDNDVEPEPIPPKVTRSRSKKSKS